MEFMTPEKKSFYSNSTIRIPINDDPTKIEKIFYVEPIVHFSIMFDVKSKKTSLLDRRIVSDDYQGEHENGTN